MEAPPGLKYSKEHEWVATEESVATIGITDHAQEQLGEIVYIELPSVGEKVYIGRLQYPSGRGDSGHACIGSCCTINDTP